MRSKNFQSSTNKPVIYRGKWKAADDTHFVEAVLAPPFITEWDGCGSKRMPQILLGRTNTFGVLIYIWQKVPIPYKLFSLFFKKSHIFIKYRLFPLK